MKAQEIDENFQGLHLNGVNIDETAYQADASAVQDIRAPKPTPKPMVVAQADASAVQDIRAPKPPVVAEADASAVQDIRAPKPPVVAQADASLVQNIRAPKPPVVAQADASLIQNIRAPKPPVVAQADSGLVESIRAPKPPVVAQADASLVQDIRAPKPPVYAADESVPLLVAGVVTEADAVTSSARRRAAAAPALGGRAAEAERRNAAEVRASTDSQRRVAVVDKADDRAWQYRRVAEADTGNRGQVAEDVAPIDLHSAWSSAAQTANGLAGSAIQQRALAAVSANENTASAHDLMSLVGGALLLVAGVALVAMKRMRAKSTKRVDQEDGYTLLM